MAVPATLPPPSVQVNPGVLPTVLMLGQCRKQWPSNKRALVLWEPLCAFGLRIVLLYIFFFFFFLMVNRRVLLSNIMFSEYHLINKIKYKSYKYEKNEI